MWTVRLQCKATEWKASIYGQQEAEKELVHHYHERVHRQCHETPLVKQLMAAIADRQSQGGRCKDRCTPMCQCDLWAVIEHIRDAPLQGNGNTLAASRSSVRWPRPSMASCPIEGQEVTVVPCLYLSARADSLATLVPYLIPVWIA